MKTEMSMTIWQLKDTELFFIYNASTGIQTRPLSPWPGPIPGTGLQPPLFSGSERRYYSTQPVFAFPGPVVLECLEPWLIFRCSLGCRLSEC